MEDVKYPYSKIVFRVMCILWGILLIFVLFTASHKFIVISGDSMDPTLKDGEVVLSSVCTSVSIGNIYMFQEPDRGYHVVKRLCGMPGDCIELRDGSLYRNGELFMESTGDNWDNMVYNLSVDEYFFLGDNRADSYDGRFWSRYIHLDEIEYQLDSVIFPLSRHVNLHWEGAQ